VDFLSSMMGMCKFGFKTKCPDAGIVLPVHCGSLLKVFREAPSGDFGCVAMKMQSKLVQNVLPQVKNAFKGEFV